MKKGQQVEGDLESLTLWYNNMIKMTLLWHFS